MTGAPPSAAALAALCDNVPATYQRQAAVWDAQRPRGLHEQVWLARAVEGLGPRARMLDLGCGAGEPIAGWMIGQGFDVTGFDVAPAMLALARGRFPGAVWIEGDMRTVLPDGSFDAIIGWDSVFHLDPVAQRAVIPRLVVRLAPGGRLLVTVGPKAGEAVGQVGSAPVYHASLAPAEYRTLCLQAGCVRANVVTDDPECDFRSVLLARRAG